MCEDAWRRLSTGSTPYLFADLCHELDTSSISRGAARPRQPNNLFSMPNDITERAYRPVQDAHHFTYSMLDLLLADGAPYGLRRVVEAQCAALQRVAGLGRPPQHFDGCRDGIRLSRKGMPRNPTL